MATRNASDLLEELCQRTKLDCDTMDLDFVKEFVAKRGKFADCTSNQSIAYAEASKTDSSGNYVHKDLIKQAAEYAQGVIDDLGSAGISKETLAVEHLIAKLLLRFIPYLSGYVLLQIDPKFAYDTDKIVATAERILAMVKKSDPDFDSKRICFKIVSTYPGLAAAKILEDKGIATLGTALFCMEQASLAGHSGCTYISPYFNELKVHFDKNFRDENKATDLCRDATAYYEAHHQKTKVKAASFVSAEEVMNHAGVDYITVFPSIINELAEKPILDMQLKDVGKYMRPPPISPSKWEDVFNKSKDGDNARKLKEAIDTFSGEQDKLEELIKKVAA
ncbi:unnamed protein product [Parascedosporium putredinis]|uniref:Transaldolase n=1 Tax=Parascedosporium putredinis TaxID=1442378 RepID=A0A9P1H2Q8_9PEZI|nr:unnamed protein product [Parascedosporium putredinis]CAI7994280.1 unnamed protein product [Parascedosporium putredinis]